MMQPLQVANASCSDVFYSAGEVLIVSAELFEDRDIDTLRRGREREREGTHQRGPNSNHQRPLDSEKSHGADAIHGGPLLCWVLERMFVAFGRAGNQCLTNCRIPLTNRSTFPLAREGQNEEQESASKVGSWPRRAFADAAG